VQLADIIASVRRHWRVSVALLMLTAVGLGLFLFTRKEVRGDDKWQAQVLLLVPVRGKDAQLPPGVPPSLLQGQSQLALSKPVIRTALRRAGLSPDDESGVTFAFKTNFVPKDNNTTTDQSGGRGDILTLTVTAPSQNLAVRLGDRYSDAYIKARRDVVAQSKDSGRRGARTSIEVLQTRLTQVDNQLQAADPSLLADIRSGDAAATRDSSGGGVAPVDLPGGTPLDTVLLAYEHRALVERITTARQTYAENSVGSLTPEPFASVVERPNPVQIVPELPSPLLPIAIAGIIGLLLAIGVPVLMDVLDHTIRDPRAAVKALQAPVLCTIPPSSSAELVGLARPGSSLDGAYRALATTSVATDQLPRAIVVTAPVGDVQDNVAANFAAALAGLGLEVALVATKPRQSWFADSVGVDNVATLSELLTVSVGGRLNGQIRERLAPSRLAHLAVLGAGPLQADDLLEGLPSVLEGLAAAGVDVTVIAGPALLEDPAATILAWSTRSVLWVVEAGEVTDQEAREAAARLELAGAAPFGVAMVAAAG
jgi:Mrp family chromosome partitioning ATPase